MTVSLLLSQKEFSPYTISLEDSIELIKNKRIQEEQRFIKSFEEELGTADTEWPL